jgi:MFS family permease
MISRLQRRLRIWWKRSLPRGQFWIYFFGAIFFNFGFSVFFFLFNLYLLNFKYDERSLGIVGSAMAVGNLCGTIPTGIAATRFGMRRTLLCGIALACLASLLRVVFVPLGAQIPLAVLGGAGLCTWGVCLSPAVASLTATRERATAFSITFASGIGVTGLGAFAAGSLPGYIRHFDPTRLSLANSERLTVLFAAAVAALSLLPLSSLSLSSSGKTMRLVRPSTPFLRQFLPSSSWAFAGSRRNRLLTLPTGAVRRNPACPVALPRSWFAKRHHDLAALHCWDALRPRNGPFRLIRRNALLGIHGSAVYE